MHLDQIAGPRAREQLDRIHAWSCAARSEMSGIPRLTASTSRRTHLDQIAGPRAREQLDRIHAWSCAARSEMSGVPRLTASTSRRMHLDQIAGPRAREQLDRIHAWSSAGSDKIAASSGGGFCLRFCSEDGGGGSRRCGGGDGGAGPISVVESSCRRVLSGVRGWLGNSHPLSIALMTRAEPVRLKTVVCVPVTSCSRRSATSVASWPLSGSGPCRAGRSRTVHCLCRHVRKSSFALARSRTG